MNSTEEQLEKCQMTLSKVFIENVEQRQILKALTDNNPDMIWAKDLEGKYILANKALCAGLLMTEPANAVGRTDVELAKHAKKQYGDRNHTFGEVCGNSDELVLNGQITRSFLESGMINGVMKYVKVIKSPMFDQHGKLIGTVGTGRDVTYFYNKLMDIAIKSSCSNTKDSVMKLLREDIFENKDVK